VDIDRSAPATAEGEIQIAASPETVWEVISEIAAWPSWNTDVKSMKLEGPVAPGSTFRWKSGSSSLVSTLKVVDPPREIAWTGVTMGIHAVHVFRFEPSDGGTRARSAESFRGLIPTVLRGYSRKVLQRGIDRILELLKAEAERRASARG
jgi:uncharacterized protein YndB with AHSA1/START domain